MDVLGDRGLHALIRTGWKPVPQEIGGMGLLGDSGESIELVECGAKVFRQGGLELERFVPRRVFEGNAPGMEGGPSDEWAFGAATASAIARLERGEHEMIGSAVFVVHGQGETGVFEMDPDLSGYLGAWGTFQEGEADEAVSQPPLGTRGLPVFMIHMIPVGALA